MHFKMMSVVHETLYGLFRDPYEPLKAAGLKPGQDVLEVGCGPGFFTVPAAEIVGEMGSMCALDINPVAVKHVQRKIDAAGATNVTALQADAADTGLPGESFDVIFLFGLRHIVGDGQSVLVELHRLLKPDGILATEGQLWDSSPLFRPLRRQGRILQFTKVQ
jgi:ubiquinone/menaquinone biosynthesis C-methylase UbiE